MGLGKRSEVEDPAVYVPSNSAEVWVDGTDII